MLLNVLLFASLFVASQCSHNLSLTYRFSIELHPNYTLFWSFDRATQNISFAVRVRTTGWVGLGLSPNGQMPQSDVVIGWVENGGRSQFHDRFAEVRSTPPIDEQQDWYLIRAEEEDGYTTLEFWRNFISCDSKDRNILPETARVVWSYHSRDPISATSSFMRHENQGSASINFLGQLQNERTVPSDSDSFTVRPFTNVNVPNADTTYWCTYFNLVNFGVTSEVFIYRVAPFITTGNTGLVHHMLLYVCPASTLVTSPGHCDNLPMEAVGCRGGQILGSWAIGGTDFIYPEGVALPVGGADNHPIVLLEVHYDNPMRRNGLTDRSGMQFYFTHQRPTHLAGGISLGYPVTPDLVVPPGAANFTVQAVCSAACLENFLPDGGITVFGSFLHSHLAGRGFTVQHTRRTSNLACDLEQELAPIDQNLNYDFDFQQSVILPRPIQIQKGDSIIVNCFYSGQNRDGVTLGGESTREEMCQDYIFYYPRIPLTACLSVPDPNGAYRPFLSQVFNGDSRVNTAINAFYFDQRDTIRALFNSITWNRSTIANYQNALMSNRDYLQICVGEEQLGIIGRQRPDITCPYAAPNPCNTAASPAGSCTCSGLGTDRIILIVFVVLVVIVAVAVVAVVVIICFLKFRKRKKQMQSNPDAELMEKFQ